MPKETRWPASSPTPRAPSSTRQDDGAQIGARPIPAVTPTLDYAVVPSPGGDLAVAWSAPGVERIWFVNAEGAPAVPATWTRRDTAGFGAGDQLAAYFGGTLRDFDLPLIPRGTAFQLEVWEALRRIPYGTTTSYGALAAALGRPGASRAVGGANHNNPLPVVVPCHRVVGAGGTLGGYAGGVRFKRILLDHELRHCFGQG